MAIFTQPARTERTHKFQLPLPVPKPDKSKKIEQKIVGENEVLFDLFYCPSMGDYVGCDVGVWWIGWLNVWSDDWSVVSCQPGVLVIYAVSAILGHWQRLAATAPATKLFCETANCRTYFLFMPHATWHCSVACSSSVSTLHVTFPYIWYIRPFF